MHLIEGYIIFNLTGKKVLHLEWIKGIKSGEALGQEKDPELSQRRGFYVCKYNKARET